MWRYYCALRRRRRVRPVTAGCAEQDVRYSLINRIIQEGKVNARKIWWGEEES